MQLPTVRVRTASSIDLQATALAILKLELLSPGRIGSWLISLIYTSKLRLRLV
jgi:hypothetical protein